MLRFPKKLSLLVIVPIFLANFGLVGLVLAQNAPAPNPQSPSGLVPCGKGDTGPNDCTFNSLITLVNNVLSFTIWVAVIGAAGLIIWIGGRMIYYSNVEQNPGKAAALKWSLLNVIKGLFIVFTAWILVKGAVSFFADDTGPLREAINRVFE